jgi:hypothetical protein
MTQQKAKTAESVAYGRVATLSLGRIAPALDKWTADRLFR